VNIQMWQQLMDRLDRMQRQIDDLKELQRPHEVPQLLRPEALHMRKKDERRPT